MASKIVLLFLFAGITLKASAISQELGQHLLTKEFDTFTKIFSKSYMKGTDEYSHRFSIFTESMELAVLLNTELKSQGLDPVHGTTIFSDMTNSEFKETMLMTHFNPAHLRNSSIQVAQPSKKSQESSFDWRLKGIVTPVKNQGHCGSCWAFSATETLESIYALDTGKLVPLSVQQIVSCDIVDHGCGGGMFDTAWDYVKSAGGLETDVAYPYDESTYSGEVSVCNKTLAGEPWAGTGPSSYMWATPPCEGMFFCNGQDEDILKDNLVSYGPISIAVDASSWSSYTGGVLTPSTCNSNRRHQDHAVQVVGYNEDVTVPYWIVRNSWGVEWGEEGYIYLQMGENTCGLADEAAVVQL